MRTRLGGWRGMSFISFVHPQVAITVAAEISVGEIACQEWNSRIRRTISYILLLICTKRALLNAITVYG
jgi:hypothetical protein